MVKVAWRQNHLLLGSTALAPYLVMDRTLVDNSHLQSNLPFAKVFKYIVSLTLMIFLNYVFMPMLDLRFKPRWFESRASTLNLAV